MPLVRDTAPQIAILINFNLNRFTLNVFELYIYKRGGFALLLLSPSSSFIPAIGAYAFQCFFFVLLPFSAATCGIFNGRLQICLVSFRIALNNSREWRAAMLSFGVESCAHAIEYQHEYLTISNKCQATATRFASSGAATECISMTTSMNTKSVFFF